MQNNAAQLHCTATQQLHHLVSTTNAGLLASLLCCCWCNCLQDLMRNACDVTNVVEAANTDGRQERLENMLVQLEQCQKALQVVRWQWNPLPQQVDCLAITLDLQ
jgi:hypothetical protein